MNGDSSLSSSCPRPGPNTTLTCCFQREELPKHLVAEVNLGCQDSDTEHTYRVYVTTFLGYGANSARERYEEKLLKEAAKLGDR